MPDCYVELLDATIRYLEGAKAQGRTWLPLRTDTWERLAGAKPAQVRQSKPAPPPSAAPPPPAFPSPSRAPVAQPPQPAAPAPASIVPPGKLAAMAPLRERALACEKCPHLARSRKNVVFGVGDINSPLLFVGEAPGADEDIQGEPFVGAAGQLLTRIIKAMGFARDTVYIANVLKCRPDTPGQTSGNRKPTPDEMQTCLPYLLEQIRIIQPKVIIALGATAMEGLFGKPIAISKVRGSWLSFEQIPVMPTYHPSYLLRNQSSAVKRQVWEDMLIVLETLGAPVSDKQRNYFKS